ncbi:uncharacterized protein LOC111099751 [Crassostrea virginica]
MNIILTSAVFTLVIFLAEGVPNKPSNTVQSVRNRYLKSGLSPLLRKIRSTHVTEPELFHSPEIKSTDEAGEVGAKLMDEFIYFLTLKDAGLLDICLAFRK